MQQRDDAEERQRSWWWERVASSNNNDKDADHDLRYHNNMHETTIKRRRGEEMQPKLN